jgi:hypothetical protein
LGSLALLLLLLLVVVRLLQHALSCWPHLLLLLHCYHQAR